MPEGKILVGLTGGIASGKTVAAEQLQKLGAGVISADAIGKEVMTGETGMLPWIRDTFGQEFFDHRGDLMRKKLGDFVFSRPDMKKLLDDKIFPLIHERLHRQIREKSLDFEVIVVDAAMIFEWGIDAEFDIILTVLSSNENVTERLKKRDGFDPDQVKSRLSSQIPPSEKAARSDYVIVNDGTLEALLEETGKFYRRITESS